ncbi:MAG: hypothetical protein PHR53_02465 [Bacteroidales bacterium]|nr:hypothetical protein [Bacteroidales bacterium]
MENINENNVCPFMVGFCRLQILPVDDLQSITTLSLTERNAIPKTGCSFAAFDCRNIQLSDIVEDGYHQLDVEADQVGTRNKHDALFNSMLPMMYILKLTDNNGITWLLGSKEEPLHFSYSHVGDPLPDGSHQYRIVFSRKTTQPLYVATA